MVATTITLLLTGSSSLTNDAQVAFVARFYTPPESKAKSDYHVYVSRLDGSKRKQISKVGGYRSVRWIDAETIAWASDDHVLEIYSLKKGTVVIKGKVLDLPGFYDARERGQVRPWGDERVLLPNGTFKKVPMASTKSLWESGSLNLESGKVVHWEASDAFDGKFRYTFDGKHLNCEIIGSPGRIHKGANSFAYLGTWSGGGSAGSTEWIYSFEPATGRVRPIISDFDGIDFDPKSRYWAAIQPLRPLVKYGKSRRVWANEIWVGDVKSGQRWRIAKGLVHGTGAVIRPGL